MMRVTVRTVAIDASGDGADGHRRRRGNEQRDESADAGKRDQAPERLRRGHTFEEGRSQRQQGAGQELIRPCVGAEVRRG